MGKLSEALGMSMDDAGEDMPVSESTEDAGDKPKVASAEVLAMKQFDRASTPEAKAQALKDFLEACGLY